jgi:hypothetical protein
MISVRRPSIASHWMWIVISVLARNVFQTFVQWLRRQRMEHTDSLFRFGTIHREMEALARSVTCGYFLTLLMPLPELQFPLRLCQCAV